MQATIRILRGSALTPEMRERLCAVAGMIVLGATALAWELAPSAADLADADVLAMTSHGEGSGRAGEGAGGLGETVRAREIMAGGYLGVTDTRRSTVEIKNPGRTEMTMRDFDWEGKPFKSPIYYGLRAILWPEASRVGAMLDFTHAKAIARFDDTASFTGAYEGKPLPPKARVGDVFKHMEFSHGHNMVTLNALARLGNFGIQPYVGVGAGISLPHTEIAFRAQPGRTYEYQYAGLVGQALVGLEVRLGRASVFLEYKFSYAPYEAPLSGVVNGWLLFTDLWRQFRAWTSREAPPDGRLATTLTTHHLIGGVLVRATPAAAR